MTAKRLSLVVGHFKALLRPKDGENDKAHKQDWTTAPLPLFDALPAFKNFPGCAWGVWGAEDELGTVNLLTDAVVKLAASEEIRLGRSVGLNWCVPRASLPSLRLAHGVDRPLNFPEKPMFARKAPEINMTVREPREVGVRDDEIHINMQSGTQWDGLRHVPIIEHEVFYNNTPADALTRGIIPLPDSAKVDPAHAKLGIQHWATHGICGRGVLLDLVAYQTSLSVDKTLPYDPWLTRAISLAQVEACAAAQGPKFCRGDVLLCASVLSRSITRRRVGGGYGDFCGDRAVAGDEMLSLSPTSLAPAYDKHPITMSTDWTTAPLPSYDELPAFKNFPGCAWGVWGTDDQLGTINLLTDAVVQRGAAEQIRTGKTVSLNWPLNFPSKPMFGRLPPTINYIQKQREGRNASRDDEIHINTQSGSQWDGLRHFPILEHETFYNNTPAVDLPHGVIPIDDPEQIDASMTRIGIQNWANHGICGRGVLLDLVAFHGQSAPDGSDVLPYDPWTTHAITVAELEACAEAQQVEFRRGDILILRVGFTRRYYAATQEERDGLRGKPETFAGIEQSEDMRRFLWNNHFAAIASDMPCMERWPTPEGVPHMHQTIIGQVFQLCSPQLTPYSLWGMPIGEMFDLEKLSQVCAEYNRYTFFVSSWPLNIIGGAASPPNAAVCAHLWQCFPCIN
ncbi:hypothetical protein MKEN_01354300 [Mycena kentingensis (nom. inval.)]|nr:hypothetical protein MKEN_01354300 [Mycena kentingensis (nom. inval.)]